MFSIKYIIKIKSKINVFGNFQYENLTSIHVYLLGPSYLELSMSGVISNPLMKGKPVPTFFL